MNIEYQRTRLMFTQYTPEEREQLKALVSAMDKVLFFEDTYKHRICIPTGMIQTIKETFPNARFTDNTKTYWDYAHINQVIHKATWRNNLQRDFIKFVIENAKDKRKIAGVLNPGTGKTFMACYSAIQVGLRTLIIAPTTSVKDQWAATLLKMFNVSPENVTNVTSPSDFIRKRADFMVVTQSTLNNMSKVYDLEKVMKDCKFGIKIIDETHMFFSNIIMVDGSCNFCHNWYLTGTYGRSGEEENRLFHEMFSDIKVFQVPDKKPTIFNRKPGDIYGLKPHMHVTMVWTHSGFSKEDAKHAKSMFGLSIPLYTRKIIPDDGHMTQWLSKLLKVIKMADSAVKYGKMLILVPTISSVDVVFKYVEQMFPHYKVARIHSQVKIPDPEKLKKESDIVVSTVKSVGTGFDLKGLAKLVVGEQFKSWILTSQVSGRLRRRDDGKDTYMWDMVDADVKQLRSWARARADVLKKTSKEFKVIDL